MEAGEGLIEARAHALELVVRVTGDQTCYVALPSRVVGVLNAAAPRLPLPLALTPADSGGWRRRSSLSRDTAGDPIVAAQSSANRGDPRHAHPRAAQAAPAFVAWAGAACVSRSETELEVPMAVAECVGLVDGDACRVAGRVDAPFADVVELAPESERDWLELLECAEDVEANLLTQCGCVVEGAPFPFWPGGGSAGQNGRFGSAGVGDTAGGSKRAPLRLVPTSVSPRGAGAVARLRLDTELRVAPWRPTPAPAAPARPADERAIATPGDSVGINSSEKSSENPACATPGAVGSRDAAPPVPPAMPVVLRVQSSRGVVVAWPRRLRFSPRGGGDFPRDERASKKDSSGRRIETDHPDEAEMAAWPTVHAFVSEATALARGLAHDALASVAAVGGGKAGRGPEVGRDKPAGGDGEGPRVFVVRIVSVPGAVVADGHVVLAPAVRDALGATQGTRVTLTSTSIVASSGGDSLLRLRPVIREGGDGSEPERGTESSSLGNLTAAHLAALGLPRDRRDVDEDAVADAARDLLARWSATAARFSMTFRRNARLGDDGDADGADPNVDDDFGAAPPVATGSVVQLRVGDDDRATFELEVHAPGGACELTSRMFFRSDDGSGEFPTPKARVELGGCVRRAAHDPSPVSKLFGTSVTVDATLRDEIETVAPVGSASREVATEATTRLAAALTSIPGGAGAPGGVLLWGAPGSGRSGVARCIARTLRDDKRTLASVVYVSCGSMSHSAGGDPRAAAAAVKAAAAAAARRAPAVVILDDLDAIAGGGGGGGGAGGGADAPGGGPGEIVGEVIADVADFLRNRRVALLATATAPESLHDAVRAAGRLDHACELRVPDAADARGAVVVAHADARGTPVSDADVAATAALKAEGYARGDLTALVERAAHAAAARSMRPMRVATPSRAAVAVANIPSRSRYDATLGSRDFDDARVGLVPAPARALGGAGVGGVAAGGGVGAGGEGSDEDPLAAVGGLDDVKAALDEALSLPSRHPAVFADAPLRLRTGALLYGPPGCGKTMVIRAAIKAAGVRSVAIKGPELLNKYIGQSEAGVRDAFRRAAAAAPCALFFDEFDSIAPRRGHDSTGVTDRVVNQFLTELDGVEGLRGVVVLAATSRPDLVDPALLRPGRLDRLLRCDFPDVAARLEILERAARDAGADDQRALNEDALGLHAVANATDGFSGADLRAIVTDARMHAVHRAMDAREGGGVAGGVAAVVTLTGEDVRRAAREARRSVPPRERERLDAVFAEFRGSRMGSVGERGATPGKSPKRVSLA